MGIGPTVLICQKYVVYNLKNWKTDVIFIKSLTVKHTNMYKTIITKQLFTTTSHSLLISNLTYFLSVSCVSWRSPANSLSMRSCMSSFPARRSYGDIVLVVPSTPFSLSPAPSSWACARAWSTCFSVELSTFLAMPCRKKKSVELSVLRYFQHKSNMMFYYLQCYRVHLPLSALLSVNCSLIRIFSFCLTCQAVTVSVVSRYIEIFQISYKKQMFALSDSQRSFFFVVLAANARKYCL